MSFVKKFITSTIITATLLVGANTTLKFENTSNLPKLKDIQIGQTAQANWFWDSIFSHEITKAYEYDRDVLNAKRREAGQFTDRSKFQRKIMACTVLANYLGEQCIYDWDEDTKQFVQGKHIGGTKGGGGSW